jgi:CheY-like chemotaxis protein
VTVTPEFAAPPQSYRILVVDDELTVLEVMQELLASAGWSVEATTSPIDALEKIKRNRYDVLLLDLYMPEMPGLLLHAKLKVADRTLHEHTVFVSGHFASHDLQRELEGTPRFVPKPFRAEVLIGAVGMALPETPRGLVSGAAAKAR